MKNIAKLAYVVLCALAISCNSFLDEEPQSDFMQEGTGTEDQESEYGSLADAQAELQGVYESFKVDIFQSENYTTGDVQSDNCYIGGDGVAEQEFDLLKLTSTNYEVELVWPQYYSMAGTVTSVIENAKMMDPTSIVAEERNRVIAEAKFLRAQTYLDTARLWGNAPMVSDLIPTIIAENLDKRYSVMYPECSATDKIYGQILDDLNEENTICYLVSKNKGIFQATKGAAYALHAKVLATRGEGSTRDYTKVVEACDEVIAEGYTLVSNFDELQQPDKEFSSEGTFEVYYTPDTPNWAYWVLLKEDDGSVIWRRYCTLAHDLVAKFDKEKDIRYASSILWKSVPYDTYWPADSYPLSYKTRGKTPNIILMRLAGILLLKTETLVELGRIPEVIRIVNSIRKRAGFAPSSLDENMGQARGCLAVENERQLELYVEGQCWFDLVRSNRLLEVMQKHKDKDGRLLFADLQAFRQLWPIP